MITEENVIDLFEELIWNSEEIEEQEKTYEISFEGSFQRNQIITEDKGFVIKIKNQEFYITVQKH